MPIERVSASDGGIIPLINPANATPTAIPSGMLCKVTAIKSIIFSPSFGSFPVFKSKSGTSASKSIIDPVPARKPVTAGIHDPAASIDGNKSDQTDAAVITPAANPSMAR